MAAWDMIDSADGDNDAIYDSLLQGVAMQDDWLLEPGGWDTSRLHLVGINNDVEQSNGDWASFLAAFQRYKDDPSDVVMDAIGGAAPRSTCTGVDPAQDFVDAAAGTGGLFLDACAADWGPHMEALGASFADGSDRYAVTRTPVPDTVAVSVDGEARTTGWTFDPTAGFVTFAPDSLPDPGSLITIDYLVDPGCD
jgi:hypothetical protein